MEREIGGVRGIWRISPGTNFVFVSFAPVQEIGTPSTCPGVSWGNCEASHLIRCLRIPIALFYATLLFTLLFFKWEKEYELPIFSHFIPISLQLKFTQSDCQNIRPRLAVSDDFVVEIVSY